MEREDGGTDRRADALAPFSDPVRAWFAGAFDGPTPVQAAAWESIAAGENTLVIAPTGSGKTLAAFLFAIDRLMGDKEAAAAAGERWAKGVRVLYVSPLKALGADVDRNLQGPLEAIRALAKEAGRDVPEVRTALRTGDTPADERRKIARNPPDILITTPESLYLMLTSQARDVLRTVQAVIVDEVHALAGDKRGAHLSLSLERLDDLLAAPAQRIGLSATVRPREEVARFLGGSRPVRVAAQEAPPCLDLAVRVPVRDLTAIPALGNGALGGRERGSGLRRAPVEEAWKSDRALRAVLAGGPQPPHPDSRAGSSSIWPHIEAAILDEVLAHRSTIVFVNSRGLAEKLTARLNELYARRLGLDVPRSEVAGWWTGAGGADDAPGPAMRSDIGGTTALAGGAAALVAKAHHGSVSKEKRLAVERELKAGELPCVVATSSLELGIDMGSIDLVIQVAPPPSVASGLQRVGRANHQVGGRSQGIIYPRTRVEVVDAAAAAEGMRAGAIEATRLVSCPLDVLAQQTVAAVASAPDGLSADEWLATVRRSACFAPLGREAFDGVLAMLAGSLASGDVAEFSPRILWDRAEGVLRPRPGSQRLAVTAAGTIPDRGMFSVVLPEGDARQGRRRVGELDEEMVMESRVGDVIALGTSTWRIAEIGADRVVVEPAPGRSARLPFWHGDVPSRPFEAGRARGAFLRAADAALAEDGLAADGDGDGDGASAEAAFDGAFEERLAAAGLDGDARRNLAALIAAQRQATGAVPTDRVLVAERCEDEAGDWRLILHAPFGRRVNEPWALAVAQRVRDALGFDPQASAADDGIILRIPADAAAVPGPELFAFDPDELEAVVRESVGSTALFAARFRECAARALLVTPAAPGKRAPLWQQRLRGGQLLEAARREQDFPLILEAARECLADVFDLPALREVMASLAAGTVRLVEARTTVPSPFAAPLVLGYLGEHLYEGDLPHAERRASLLAVDPRLLGELIGGGSLEDVLDPEVTAQVEAELQRIAPGRRARGAEGAFDLLRQLGPLTAEEVAARLAGVGAAGDGADAAPAASAAEAREALRELKAARRAYATVIAGEERWAVVDDAARLLAVLGAPAPDWALARAAAPAPGGAGPSGPSTVLAPNAAFASAPVSAPSGATPSGASAPDLDAAPVFAEGTGALTPSAVPALGAEFDSPPSDALTPAASPDVASDGGAAALDALVARYARTHGPFDATALAARLGLGAALVVEPLERLAAAGRVTRLSAGRWVDSGVLRRLRARSLARAREAVRPVPAAAYARLLIGRQGVPEAGEPAPLRGIDGVAQVIAQFEGAFLPAAQWESSLLPARVPDYRPALLDELIAEGEVMWVGAPAPADVSGSRRPAAAAQPGLVALFPTDSPLAPLPLDADLLPAEAPVELDASGFGVLTPGAAVRQVLASAGPLAFPQIVDGVRRLMGDDVPAERAIAEVLAALAWAGEATSDTLAFPRAGGLAPARSEVAPSRTGQVPPPARRRASSRRGRGLYAEAKAQARAAVVARHGARTAFDAALAGRWSLLAPTPEDGTLRAIALTESVLDRYGVVTRDTALLAGVPGGLSSLMPVLRSLEEAGELARGMFVEGLGPAQFAARETVEALRALAAAPAPAPALAVIPADDPACLWGAGIPWPDPAAPQAPAPNGAEPPRPEPTLAPTRCASDAPYPALDAPAATRSVDPDGCAPEDPVLGAFAPKRPTLHALEASQSALEVPATSQPAVAMPRSSALDASAIPRPTRREGALVVVADGAPVLWAAPRLKALVAFTDDESLLAAAARALVDAVRAQLRREGPAAARRKVLVETLNGASVLVTPLADVLQDAGLVRLPDGLRLYADPFAS